MPRIAPSRQLSAQQLNLLEELMEAYYAAVPDYLAFQQASNNPLEWRHVLAEVTHHSSSQEPVSILEFGSGRSGFPNWLRDQLALDDAHRSLAITCQDVTATNRIHLQEVADHVVIAPLQEGVLPPASFEIIFSTHCLEHVARPEKLLHTLINLLKPGGSLLLFAPRYELPFYISPSSLDLNIWQRILLSFKLLSIRLIHVLRRRPAFVIDTKPACLTRPFRRDEDAIHWVSLQDLRLFASLSALSITELGIGQDAPFPSKQWLIDTFGKLAIKLQKPYSRPSPAGLNPS